MLLAFAAVVLVLLGASVLVAGYLLRKKAREDLEKRLDLIAAMKPAPQETTDAFGGLLKVRTRKFDMQTRRLFAVGIRHTWAMSAGTLTLLLTAATSTLGTWIVMHSFFGLSLLPAAALSLCAGFFGPRFILSSEQKRTERRFTDVFPDAVDTVARMVRAGLPITAAVRTVAIESSPPVSEVFSEIADQVRIGVPIEKILDESSTRIGLPDFRFFTVAVGLQYSTGGNLTQTLEILSDVIRKRRAMRLKAKAASGEIRITAYTLTAVPIIAVGALLFIQPAYLVPLWTDPRGHFIIAAAVVLLLFAFLSMRAMMRSISNV
jgi:tight adherence protein B